MTAAHTLTAYERGPAVLHAVVHGLPIAQGNISHLGKGRPAIYGNQKLLKPWRQRLHWELRHCVNGIADFPLAGPVAVDITFTMPKPKAAPKKRRTYPITRPDRGKLARAVEDALTEAGVIRDDSQIVDGATRKVFPGEHPLALGSPGAVVYVYMIGGA